MSWFSNIEDESRSGESETERVLWIRVRCGKNVGWGKKQESGWDFSVELPEEADPSCPPIISYDSGYDMFQVTYKVKGGAVFWTIYVADVRNDINRFGVHFGDEFEKVVQPWEIDKKSEEVEL